MSWAEQVLSDPAMAATLGRRLAVGWVSQADVVLTHRIEDLSLGQEVARSLGVRHVFAECTDGALALRRGFALRPWERVLVVEAIATAQFFAATALVRELGAAVVGRAELTIQDLT